MDILKVNKPRFKKRYACLISVFLLFIFSNFYLLHKITSPAPTPKVQQEPGSLTLLLNGIKEDLKDSIKEKSHINKPDMTVEDFKKEVLRLIDVFK